MKKLILTMAAMLTIGVAAAQTNPNQPPQPSTTPLPPPKTELKEKPVKDEKILNDGVTKQPNMQGEIQPRKDEIKTQGHVKSTPKLSTNNDTVKPVEKVKKKGN